jgi:hypothetical protein
MINEFDEVRTVIHAIYAAISGPAGERDWASHSKHFVPEARSYVLHRSPGGDALKAYSQEEYARSRGPFFRAHSFWEIETRCEIRVDGPFATALSYYDSYWDLSQQPFESGVNTIQLVKLDREWKIAAIMWEARSAAAIVAASDASAAQRFNT